MALFSYPVCTWLCQYVNMGVRKWLEKSAEKQKYKMRKTANPLSRKAFRAVSFSATKDTLGAWLFCAPAHGSAERDPACPHFTKQDRETLDEAPCLDAGALRPHTAAVYLRQRRRSPDRSGAFAVNTGKGEGVPCVQAGKLFG